MPIPKTIHYCWFGNNPKSDLILRCIESWKEYLPDYKIIEWNEDNFDVNCCTYTTQAYKNKKWAFVSDYCRFWALEKYGGIYLDTDVEIIKDISPLLQSPLMGFESKKSVNPGLIMATDKDDWLCEKMLAQYSKDNFETEGENAYKTICERTTELLQSEGLVLDDEMQTIRGYTIYPSYYFNPMGNSIDANHPDITENTYTIHHYAASWVSDDMKNSLRMNWKGRLYHGLYNKTGGGIARNLRIAYRFVKKKILHR